MINLKNIQIKEKVKAHKKVLTVIGVLVFAIALVAAARILTVQLNITGSNSEVFSLKYQNVELPLVSGVVVPLDAGVIPVGDSKTFDGFAIFNSATAPRHAIFRVLVNNTVNAQGISATLYGVNINLTTGAETDVPVTVAGSGNVPLPIVISTSEDRDAIPFTLNLIPSVDRVKA